MINSLKTEIKSLADDVSLTSLISTRFYYGQAPQDEPEPHVVYSFHPAIPDDDSMKDRELLNVDFTVYSDKSSSSECTTILRALNNLIRSASLTLTDYIVNDIQRLNQIEMPQEERGWQATTEFRFILQLK
jgi:hypothetical protein